MHPKLIRSNLVSILLAVVSTSALAGEGGSAGGGGGFVLVNGQPVLLSELPIKPNLFGSSADIFDVSRKLTTGQDVLESAGRTDLVPQGARNELLHLIQKINLAEKYRNGIDLKSFEKRLVEVIAPKKGVFLPASEVDESVERIISKSYSDVSGVSAPILAAVSDGYRTYLLPQFNFLTDIQKAKLLIHEAAMRAVFNEKSLRDIQLMNQQLSAVFSIDRYFESVSKNEPLAVADTITFLTLIKRVAQQIDRANTAEYQFVRKSNSSITAQVFRQKLKKDIHLFMSLDNALSDLIKNIVLSELNKFGEEDPDYFSDVFMDYKAQMEFCIKEIRSGRTDRLGFPYNYDPCTFKINPRSKYLNKVVPKTGIFGFTSIFTPEVSFIANKYMMRQSVTSDSCTGYGGAKFFLKEKKRRAWPGILCGDGSMIPFDNLSPESQ